MVKIPEFFVGGKDTYFRSFFTSDWPDLTREVSPGDITSGDITCSPHLHSVCVVCYLVNFQLDLCSPFPHVTVFRSESLLGVFIDFNSIDLLPQNKDNQRQLEMILRENRYTHTASHG